MRYVNGGVAGVVLVFASLIALQRMLGAISNAP
jgi:hypothetical protein